MIWNSLLRALGYPKWACYLTLQWACYGHWDTLNELAIFIAIPYRPYRRPEKSVQGLHRQPPNDLTDDPKNRSKTTFRRPGGTPRTPKIANRHNKSLKWDFQWFLSAPGEDLGSPLAPVMIFECPRGGLGEPFGPRGSPWGALWHPWEPSGHPFLQQFQLKTCFLWVLHPLSVFIGILFVTGTSKTLTTYVLPR
jgi:hypothetical protein